MSAFFLLVVGWQSINLAADDVEQCVQNFEKSLEVAKSLRRPKFLRSHNSLDDWIRRSRTQSEFGPLRKDKRYAAIIKKMKADDE